MSRQLFDLLVIGGGINGAGIAADAAGRGLKVLLAEAHDLGGATSSASSKLIHGGLRYLEYFAFRLVREALAEREVLLANAPHIVWPLRFILPHTPGMRAAPMLSAGLFIYDHLAPRRTLSASQTIDLRSSATGHPLKKQFHKGFTYWDCWVDDARLVIANAKAARNRGAEILTRTPVIGLNKNNDVWEVSLGSEGSLRVVGARAVVNAAGPWAGAVATLVSANTSDAPQLNLVKGSHIVVPRIAGADMAYIFQNRDGRVVFALPFENAFTLIGTTDMPFEGDVRQVSVSAEEEGYLLDVANTYFEVALTPADIVWKFAGVRPLEAGGSDNPSAASRDYRLEIVPGPPVMLHVIGGKITTYRRLAEAALSKLAPHLPPMRKAWTATSPLPGGDVGPDGFDAWFRGLCSRKPGFSQASLLTLARRYGTETEALLQDALSLSDLGKNLGAGLTAREVVFLRSEEWALTADDVLWRRTKAGLHVRGAHFAALHEGVQAILDGK